MACINKSVPANFRCNAASSMPFEKYRPWSEYMSGLPVDEKWSQRKWPEHRLLRAPRWCSVDLRDGNQALIDPMDVDKKIRYFQALVQMGFKEIEVGFPSASKLDFDFCRLLIEKNLVPQDVWIMVLVQAREHLITQTIEALRDSKRVIIHLYNSTSELQRRVVFNMSKEAVKDMAVKGTQIIRKLVNDILIPSGSHVRFEYSPESFTGTEIEYALEVCHAVMDVWNPTAEDPMILNLPETVQNAGPHFYADQIEWMHCHLKDRDNIVISIHPHNDRGTGVASAELAMMAGADRVEGCLFGNGERTGNVCLTTLAINFFQHGMDPELDFSDLPAIVKMFEECTGMKIPPRHPWAGELVYTAFSGSHQDAIRKGLMLMEGLRFIDPKKKSMNKKAKELKAPNNSVFWEVPYLPIDPADLGRSYEAIVRINSQSGKGGIAFLMETEFGISLPRELQSDLSKLVQTWCDNTAKEVNGAKVYDIFSNTYFQLSDPISLRAYRILSFESSNNTKDISCSSTIISTCESQTAHKSLEEDFGSVSDQQQQTDNRDDDSNIYQFMKDNEWVHLDESGNKLFSATEASSECKVQVDIKLRLVDQKDSMQLSGSGNGPLDAIVNALNCWILMKSVPTIFKKFVKVEIQSFQESALTKGSSAEAISFVDLRGIRKDTTSLSLWGSARHTNTTSASINALFSAFNRLLHS